ncbi:MAG: biotin/lipoyl-binding protein [Bacteroidetes bacterium]|nr:biotin/lipoyl-binding protein [Bacteroidota bacterium]MCH8523723.1 acetyl-CoA carboxylase biotin carboxyl carrier protein subunit [Balneolales bacterium]
MELQATYKRTKRDYKVVGKDLQANHQSIEYWLEPYGDDGYILSINGDMYQVYDVDIAEDTISFTLDGARYSIGLKDEQTLLLEKMGFKSGSKKTEGNIKAPMPGKILRVEISEGDSVDAGQTVIVLEAMKMENELKATASGKILKIYVATGESVEKNTTLIEIG